MWARQLRESSKAPEGVRVKAEGTQYMLRGELEL